MMFWGLSKGITPEHLGFLPTFLSDDDSRPAKEQLDANYAHGGGWFALPRFTLNSDDSLSYPGDPVLKPIAFTVLRGEKILLYPGDFVAIVQMDTRAFEVARLD